MKSFLEHTKTQNEGIGDTLKKGAAKAGGAIKKAVVGDSKSSVMDRVKSGAKKVVQAVGREFQKGKDQAKAERQPKPEAPAPEKKKGKQAPAGIAELEPTENETDETGDAFVKKSKEAKIKKDDEKEEEQRKLEAGYAPLPVEQR